MLQRLAFLFFVVIANMFVIAAAPPPNADALLITIGDQHSAYDRTAQFIGLVDRLHAANPDLPLAILIDGDVFERGNAIAARTKGEIDFAMLAALAQRAPTILNIGNHEPEFYPLSEMVRRAEVTGVKVIGNVVDRGTGLPVAPSSLKFRLGKRELTLVGMTTDRLATFPAFVRDALKIPDPVAWAKDNVPKLLADADVGIVLSHAGLVVDRAWLPIAPTGTLVIGGHDHLQFVHRENNITYLQSGSWDEYATAVWLCRNENGQTAWHVEQVPIAGEADPALRAVIADVIKVHATEADRAIVGHLPRALSLVEAEQFVTAAVRDAAHVDAAFIGHTTFGAGLPVGAINQLALDACVRFDGTICTGEIDGARLRELVAHANQTSETAWTERTGDYLVTAAPMKIEAGKRYTIAVSDWIARNPSLYLGEPIHVVEQPTLRLKSIATRALAPK